MIFPGWFGQLQVILNAIGLLASLLLSVEYLHIVRIRKPPYPWASYSVSLVLFALASERLILLAHPDYAQSQWQIISHVVTNIVLFVCMCLIPLVRRETYKRPKFNQLQDINEELRYSQHLLKSYMDEAPIVAYIKDENGKIIQLSEGYYRLFKRNADGPTREAPTTNLYEGQSNSVAESAEEAVATKRSDTQRQSSFEGGFEGGPGSAPAPKGLQKTVTETIEINDEKRAIYDIRFPLSGPNNEHMLGGIIVDITDRLRWKNRIEVFSSLVELSPDAIYCYDGSGRVFTWNHAAEVMFGYSRDEMIGKSITEIVPAVELEEFLFVNKTLRDNSKPSATFETTCLTKSGVRKPVVVAAARVPGITEANLAIACVTRDITQKKQLSEQIKSLHKELELRVEELKKTNQDLERARDQALESARVKSAFVANISHELRTPLSGILGMSELSCQETNDPDTKRLLEMTHESAQGLLHVVDDILDLARLEAGKTNVEKANVELRKFVEECVNLFLPSTTGRPIELRLSISDAVPDLVHIDQSLVRRVMMNLLSNAIKFTPQGWIDVYVSLDDPFAEDMLSLKFSVADSGVGIAQSDMDTLLTPKVRVTQSYDGTSGAGLGLSVSKRIVDLMGGQLGCESRQGDGSIFWFTLPCERVKLPKSNLDSLKAQPGAALDLSRFKILAVDDNPVVARLTMMQLTSMGIAGIGAKDGKEAIDKASAADFDAILMDVQLPDMNGYEAAKQIRQHQEKMGKRRNVIIALTGNSSREDREAAMAAGMDDFMTKPVSIDVLKKRLGKWLLD